MDLRKKLEKIGRPDAKQWDGWHTCFRSEWEAVAVLQKPLCSVESFGLAVASNVT